MICSNDMLPSSCSRFTTTYAYCDTRPTAVTSPRQMSVVLLTSHRGGFIYTETRLFEGQVWLQ